MKEIYYWIRVFVFCRVVNGHKYLVLEQKEYVLSKQFLRSGTSIGANADEAVGVQSTNDFLSKLAIAYKEARETRYWVRLLHATGYQDKEQSEGLLRDVEELLRIIGGIQLTTKANRNS